MEMEMEMAREILQPQCQITRRDHVPPKARMAPVARSFKVLVLDDTGDPKVELSCAG